MTKEIIPTARSKSLATIEPGAIVEVVEQWRCNDKEVLAAPTNVVRGSLHLQKSTAQAEICNTRLRLRVCGSASINPKHNSAVGRRSDVSRNVASSLKYSQLGGWLTAHVYTESNQQELTNFVPVAREATQTLLPRLVIAFVWLHQEAIVEPTDLQELLGVRRKLMRAS